MTHPANPQTPSAVPAPRVSVIIPTYNTAGFIAEALQSVFAQSFTDFEVIVINDGSPDTEQLERTLQPFRQRLAYLKQANGGPSAARNRGIEAARGEFLAFLDSDDSWLPDYLSLQMQSFAEHPELDVVCADTEFYGDPQMNGHTFLAQSRLRGPVTFAAMLMGNPLTTSCVVARKRVAVQAGLFDESLRVAEDYDLWLRMAAGGAVIKRRWKVLARHRVHPGGLSAEDETLWLKSHIQVLGKVEKNPHLSAEMRQSLRRQLADFRALLDTEQGKRYLATGAYEQAIDSFRCANALLRSRKIQLILAGLRIAPALTRMAAAAWERLGRQKFLRANKSRGQSGEPLPQGLV